MSEPITTRHVNTACDRLAARLDACLALVESQVPPVDQAAADRMHAAAAEALASWGTPPGWDDWG